LTEHAAYLLTTKKRLSMSSSESRKPLICLGISEPEISNTVNLLAAQRCGISTPTPTPKGVVRSGANMLTPYGPNLPDLLAVLRPLSGV
jgi:hypothetical protein